MARKLPKRGFRRYGRKTFAIVNVEQLEKVASEGELNPALLRKKRVIEDLCDGLRVLGDGELKSAITVHAHHFTKTARTKIEAAGGKAVVIK